MADGSSEARSSRPVQPRAEETLPTRLGCAAHRNLLLQGHGDVRGARCRAPPPSARAHCLLGGASAVDVSHGNASGPEGPGSAAGAATSIVGRELPTDLPRGDVVPGRPRVAFPLGRLQVMSVLETPGTSLLP